MTVSMVNSRDCNTLESPFPQWGKRGMAVSDHIDASEAGCQVLREGGNAIDAAVTVSLTLGVVCPHYTGIGGGGFALFWLPGMDQPKVLDYREVAPSKAHPEMFGDDELASIRGGLAVGVPGAVAGLAHLLEEYGTISWERALAPGIELARRGVKAYPNLRRVVHGRSEHLQAFPETARLFLGPDGQGPGPGDVLVMDELADTYERLARNGPREFYEGETARLLIAGIQESGGLMTEADLASYRWVDRPVLKGGYKGRDVYTIGPPSAGGIQLLQMLHIMEPFGLGPADYGSALAYHLQAEAMRISFADRSIWVADPAFFKVPVEALLDRERLDELHAIVKRDQTLELFESPPLRQRVSPEGVSLPGVGGTAAFLAADEAGGFVAATESINLWFGSMVMPTGTGVILNDVMDDFSRNPGIPDAFGLVSSRINEVEPGKRPSSSSCPALIFRDGRPVAALASAGGPRIATTVFQLALNLYDHELNIQQALDGPRVHHQWLPNELAVEWNIPADVRAALEKKGHRVVEGPSRSHAVGLLRDETDGIFYGAGDLRAGGEAAGWS
jgi:gamma-glutamyltranspeptidase/glutathione hydrolase